MENKKGNLFWHSQETIEEHAQNYKPGKIFSTKNVLAVFVFFSILAGALITGGGEYSVAESVWGTIVVAAPFIYFLIRGYRFAFVLLIIWFTGEKLYQLIIMPKTFFSAFLWWIVIFRFSTYVIRLENARARLGLAPKTKVWLDVLIAFVIFVACALAAIIYFMFAEAGTI
ncbi:hypothetical protein Dip510_000869 [Elusimicrobium posterum]|uniref:hypothetical protein n=1 Tax=Elusimicrobium posterum TaxID=3116653 RepID=UPI003C7803CF